MKATQQKQSSASIIVRLGVSFVLPEFYAGKRTGLRQNSIKKLFKFGEYMSELKTPLNAWHVAQNAKMAPFGGWDMPIQYEGILAEHHHTRSSASIFDICHMGQIIIKGDGVKDKLSKALTHNLETLAVGKCRYGFLLTEKGTVMDDLIVYRLAEEKFMLVVNAACAKNDYAAVVSRIGAEYVEDVSANFGKIDLQGPKSFEVLQRVLGQDCTDLKYFSFKYITYKGKEIMVSRTGYTGELGVELYYPRDFSVTLWEDLAADADVKPAGLGARDTLRLECGMALYGHELDEDHTVAESGLGGMLNSEAQYVGKELAKEVVKEFLVPLALEGRRSARNGDSIILESGSEEVIGIVTSGSFAPSLSASIAFAYVKKQYQDNAEFIIKSGKNELLAKKTDLPFYKEGTARQKLS